MAPKRGRRGGRKQVFAATEEVLVEERQVSSAYNLPAPATLEATQPLRLLDGFTLFTADEGGTEQLTSLAALEDGLADGLALQASGLLLDHRTADQSVAEAQAGAYVRVRIPRVLDWVLDYSDGGAIWAVSGAAWYRLLSPASEYASFFAPILERLQLARSCAFSLQAAPAASLEDALLQVESGAAANAVAERDNLDLAASDEGEDRWTDGPPEWDPYAAVLETAPSGQAVMREAAFLAPQMAPFLGRHAHKSGLLQGLAQRAGVAMEDITAPGRPLLRFAVSSSSPADPALRPAPRSSFLAPASVLPGILMVWDFCQSFRALLRLPPFPLVRLELAFMDEAPPESAAAQLAALRPATPVPSAAPSPSPTPTPGGAQPGHAPNASHNDVPAGPKGPPPVQNPASAIAAIPSSGAPTSAAGISTAAGGVTGGVSASALGSAEAPAVLWGVGGQGALLKDVHLCLLRVLEGLDEELQEAPTMAGYGSAAELGPQEVYRPLLGVTWPELVRHALSDFCAQNPDSEAAAAVEELKVKEYSQLSGKTRLALLEALIAVAADTEIVRDYLQDSAPDTVNDRLPRGVPLGIDASGNRYFLLAAESGMQRLFVNSRDEGEDESGPGSWGWYSAEEVPQLLEWLESGDLAERELAEDLHEAFLPQLQAAAQEAEASALPGSQPDALADGYLNAKAEGGFVAALRNELLSLFKGVRFWEKDANWLRARSAVIVELQRAQSGLDFARLMWLMEDLMYGDLLKGTGWGRKRAWFREQLEMCSTLSQAAVVACQLALHCRRSADMGFMSIDKFRQGLARCRVAPQYIPMPTMEAVLSRRGYAAHCAAARPPADTGASPLPETWSHTEHCNVKEIVFVRGNWQRPTWQGRFAGGPAPPHPHAEDLIVACLLLQRKGAEVASNSTEGEIDWRGFTFQYGFRQPRQTHTIFGARAKTPPTGSLSPSPSPSQLFASGDAPSGPKAETEAAKSEPKVETDATPSGSRTEGADSETDEAGSAPAEELPPSVKPEAAMRPLKAESAEQETAASAAPAVKVEAVTVQQPNAGSSSAPTTKPAPAADSSAADLHPDVKADRGAPYESNTTTTSGSRPGPGVAEQANASAGSVPTALGNRARSAAAQNGSSYAGAANAGGSPSGPASAAQAAQRTVAANAPPGSGASAPACPAVEDVHAGAPTPVANCNQRLAAQRHPPTVTPSAAGSRLSSQPANGAVENAAAFSGRLLDPRPIAAGGTGNGWASTASRMAPSGSMPGVSMDGLPVRGFGSTVGVKRERQAAASLPSGVGMWTPGQDLPPRQRGRRDRGGADTEGERSISTRRSQRGSATELYVLEKGNIAVARKQEAATGAGIRGLLGLGGTEGDDDTSAEDLESVRYWTRDRDLAAVTVYVRTNGPPVVEFLIQPSQYAMGMSRTWPRGLPVKMPAFGRLSAALSAPQPQPASRWITGVLTSSFPFNALSAPFLRMQPILPAPLPGAPGRPPASAPAAQGSTPMPANFLTAALSSAAGIPSFSRNLGGASVLPEPKAAVTNSGSAASQSTAAPPGALSQPVVMPAGPHLSTTSATANASAGSRAAPQVAAPQPAAEPGGQESKSADRSVPGATSQAAFAAGAPPQAAISVGMAQPGSAASLPTQPQGVNSAPGITPGALRPASLLPVPGAPGTPPQSLQPVSLAPPVGPPSIPVGSTPSSLPNHSAAANAANASLAQPSVAPQNPTVQPQHPAAQLQNSAVQRGSSGRLPGLRLGELVGRGPGAQHGAGGGAPGAPPGFGGFQDPWKSLEVKWEDAPMHWPIRVSPWEVVEDVGGVVRAERARLREETYRANMAARKAAEEKRAEMQARSQLAQQQYFAQQQALAMRAGQAGQPGQMQQPTGVAEAARLAAMKAAQQATMAGGQAQAARAAPMSYTALLAASGPLPTAANSSFPSQPAQQTFTGAGPPRPSVPGMPGQVQSSVVGQHNSAAGQQNVGQAPMPGIWAARPAAAGGLLAKQGAMSQGGMSQREQQQWPVTGPGGQWQGSAPGPGQVVQGVAVPGVPVWMPAKAGQTTGVATAAPPAAASHAQPQSASGSPEVQPEGSKPGRKRGRSSDDKPAAKGSTEGYRERWLAKRPRPNPTSWVSAFCSACESPNPQGLLVCMGPCLRSFHATCIGLTEAPQEPWFCPECDAGRMRCFICGQLSAGFEDQSLRKCSLGVCGRFYHLVCAERDPLTQMAKKGAHFRCPQHYCAECRRSGDGVDMTKCIRCPTAYHTSCLPPGARKLLPQSKVILCAKHKEGDLPPSFAHPRSAASMAHKEAGAPVESAPTAALTAGPVADASAQAPPPADTNTPASAPLTVPSLASSGRHEETPAAPMHPAAPPGGPTAILNAQALPASGTASAAPPAGASLAFSPQGNGPAAPVQHGIPHTGPIAAVALPEQSVDPTLQPE